MKVEKVGGGEEEEAEEISVIVSRVVLIRSFRVIVGSRILGMEVIIEVEVGVEATMRMEIRTISRKGMLWRVGHHLMEEEAAHMDEAAVFLLERNILPLDGVSMTVEVELDAGKLFVLVD